MTFLSAGLSSEKLLQHLPGPLTPSTLVLVRIEEWPGTHAGSWKESRALEEALWSYMLFLQLLD